MSASPTTSAAPEEHSARPVDDARLLARIREVHEVDYDAYGYRRSWKTLTRANARSVPCKAFVPLAVPAREVCDYA
jgi:hypothetical protein